MIVEAHLTVSHSPNSEAQLRNWLEQQRMKLTRIELARGRTPDQAMVTTWLSGAKDDGVREGRAIADALAPLEIVVTRVKLEVAHTSTAIAAHYLEHHVLVVVGAGIERLEWVGRRHGAHLSRSARRLVGETEERFLTQRFRPQTAEIAAAGLEAMLAELRAESFEVRKVERERVIHDDNLSLDAGWAQELSP